MHLDSLKIKNFRILEDIEINKLGHVNLIVGKNNSGKSTILEALMLLAGSFNQQAILEVASMRGDTYINTHSDTKDLHIAIKNFFTHKKLPTFCEESLLINGDKHELTVSYIRYRGIPQYDYLDKRRDVLLNNVFDSIKIVNSSSEEVPNILLSNHFHNTSNGLRVKRLYSKAFNANSSSAAIRDGLIELDENAALPLANTKSYEAPLPYSLINSQLADIASMASEFDELVLNSNEKYVIEALKIIEPQITDLAFLAVEGSEKRQPYVKLEEHEKRVPLHSMGEGAIRLLQLIIRLFKAKDGLLLIDEFANNLHYSIQENAWKLIFELANRFNIQIFATTYSWDCIESFVKVAKERQDLQGVLARMGQSVRKSNKGKIIATVFDEEELYNLTEDRIEARLP